MSDLAVIVLSISAPLTAGIALAAVKTWAGGGERFGRLIGEFTSFREEVVKDLDEIKRELTDLRKKK